MAAAAEITEVKKTDFSVIRILNNSVYLEKINNYVNKKSSHDTHSIIKIADNIFAYNNRLINDDILSTDTSMWHSGGNNLLQFGVKGRLLMTLIKFDSDINCNIVKYQSMSIFSSQHMTKSTQEERAAIDDEIKWKNINNSIITHYDKDFYNELMLEHQMKINKQLLERISVLENS